MKYLIYVSVMIYSIHATELTSGRSSDSSLHYECDIPDSFLNKPNSSDDNLVTLQEMQKAISESLSKKETTLQEMHNTLTALLEQSKHFKAHIEQDKENHTQEVDKALEKQQQAFHNFLETYLTTLINTKIEVATSPIIQEIQKLFDTVQKKQSKLNTSLHTITQTLKHLPYTANTTTITSYAMITALSIVALHSSRTSTATALALPIITYLGAKQYYGFKYNQLKKIVKTLSSRSDCELLLPQAQNLANICFSGQPEYNAIHTAIMNFKIKN